jgi:hypothetical protein
LERQYTLSPEQAKEIDENPATAIPKLMARVHYQSHIAAYTGIMSQLPNILERILDQRDQIQKAHDTFFTRWPDLKDPKFSQAVDMGLRAYRQANPKASFEEITEKAGLMLMISLGLGLPQATSPVQPPAPALHAPPPIPAGTSGSGAPRPADRGAVDVWSEMLKDDVDS